MNSEASPTRPENELVEAVQFRTDTNTPQVPNPVIVIAGQAPLVVRTYDGAEGYASWTESGTESGAESTSEQTMEAPGNAEAEEEIQASLILKLEENQAFMKSQIPSWTIDTTRSEVIDVKLIAKPTASGMTQQLLNPYIYRQIQDLGSLDALAILLESPADWEAKYSDCITSRSIRQCWHNFVNLPESASEANIQFGFSDLVTAISFHLDVYKKTMSETPVIVGGILALHEYDLRSRTDPHMKRDDGVHLLATEVKSHAGFPVNALWYYNCRGAQTLTAMYAFNCPTLLLSHKTFKLFVETRERDGILTFPFGSDADRSSYVNSTAVMDMGIQLLQIIVICLLSKRSSQNNGLPQVNSSLVSTPRKLGAFGEARVLSYSAEKRPRRSERLMGSRDGRSSLAEDDDDDEDACQAPDVPHPVPSFAAGFQDGKPVRRFIRVMSPEDVMEMERGLEEKRTKESTLARSSDSTLELFLD